MADFTGIQLQIVLPSEANVANKVKELQTMIDKHQINIKFNIPTEALNGLQKLSQMYGNINKQSANIKAPMFDFANPGKEAQLFLNRVDALVAGFKRFGGETTYAYNEFGKLTAKVKNAEGIVKDYAFQWDKLRNAFRKTDVKTSDNLDVVNEKKLQEEQKINNKLQEQYREQLQANLSSVQNYYEKQQNLIQKTIESRQKELEQLKEQVYNRLSSGSVSNEAQLQYEQKLRQAIKERQQAEVEASKTTEHWLNIQKQNFDAGILKFTQQKAGLFDPEQLANLQERFKALSPTANDLREQVQLLKAEFNTMNAEAIAKGFNSANKSAMSFGDSIKTAAYKMGIWVGVGGVIFGALSQLKEAFSFIKEIDTLFTTLQMEMTDTVIDLKDLGKQANDFAIAMGTSTQNVAEAINIFGNYNTTLEDTITKSQSAIILSNLTGDTIKNSADALLSISQQFGYSADDFEHITDILAGSARLLQIDYPEAIKQTYMGIERVGSVAEQSGIGLERLSAMIGTVAESTRMSGDVIGNAYKTIFSRMTAVNEEINPEEYKKVEKAFNDIGIAIKDSATSIRPLSDVFDSLAERWDTLNDVQKNSIAFEAAGIRQKNIFIATMNKYNDILKNTEMAENSQGVALQKQEIYMKSLQARVNQFTATLQNLYTGVAEPGTLKTIVDIGTAGIDQFGKLASIIGTLPALIGAATFAIALFSNKLRDGVLSNFNILTMFKNLWTTIPNLINRARLEIALINVSMKEFGATTTILNVIKTGFTAIATSANLAKIAVAGLEAVGTLGLSVLFTWLSDKLLTAWDNFINKEQKAKEAFDDLRKSIINTHSEITEGNQLLSVVEQLNDKTNKSVEENQKLGDAKQRLASLFPSTITGFDQEGKAISDNMDLVKQYIKLKQDELKANQDAMAAKFASDGNSDFKELQKQVTDYNNKLLEIRQKQTELFSVQNTPISGTFTQAGKDSKIAELTYQISDLSDQTSALLPNINASALSLKDMVSGFIQTSDSINKLDSGKILTLLYTLQNTNTSNFFSLISSLDKSDFSKILNDGNKELQEMVKNNVDQNNIVQRRTELYNTLYAIITQGEAKLNSTDAKSWLDKILPTPEKVEQAKQSIDELDTSIEQMSSRLKDTIQVNEALDSAMKKLADGERLTAGEVENLITLYPPLLDKMKDEHGNINITVDLLKQAKEAYNADKNAKIDSNIAKLNSDKAHLEGTILIIKAEMQAIKDLMDVYASAAGQKQQDFVKLFGKSQNLMDKQVLSDIKGQPQGFPSDQFITQNRANLDKLQKQQDDYAKSAQEIQAKINKLGVEKAIGKLPTGGADKDKKDSNKTGIDSIWESVKKFKTSTKEANDEYYRLKKLVEQKTNLGILKGFDVLNEKVKNQEQYVNNLFEQIPANLQKQLEEWQTSLAKYKPNTKEWLAIRQIITDIKNAQGQIPKLQTQEIENLKKMKNEYDPLIDKMEKMKDKVAETVEQIKSIGSNFKNSLEDIFARMNLNSQFKTEIFGKPEDIFSNISSAYEETLLELKKQLDTIMSRHDGKLKMYTNLKDKDEKGTLTDNEKVLWQELQTQEDISQALKDYNLTKDEILKKEEEFAKLLKIEKDYQEKVKATEDELKLIQKESEKMQRLNEIKQKQVDLTKQLAELEGILNDNRFEFINEQGQKILTYDREKVLDLQKEVSDRQKEISDLQNKDSKTYVDNQVKMGQEYLDLLQKINDGSATQADKLRFSELQKSDLNLDYIRESKQDYLDNVLPKQHTQELAEYETKWQNQTNGEIVNQTVQSEVSKQGANDRLKNLANESQQMVKILAERVKMMFNQGKAEAQNYLKGKESVLNPQKGIKYSAQTPQYANYSKVYTPLQSTSSNNVYIGNIKLSEQQSSMLWEAFKSLGLVSLANI